jgi:HPt (histidine-containing phosphotransfer) domain-containing protein
MPNLVDFDRLASFTDGDAALEAELFDLFVATAARYLDALALAAPRTDQWRATAHSLKGAAANIGATAVAELAAKAEHAEPDPELLAALNATFAATRAVFQQQAA